MQQVVKICHFSIIFYSYKSTHKSLYIFNGINVMLHMNTLRGLWMFCEVIERRSKKMLNHLLNTL